MPIPAPDIYAPAREAGVFYLLIVFPAAISICRVSRPADFGTRPTNYYHERIPDNSIKKEIILAIFSFLTLYVSW